MSKDHPSIAPPPQERAALLHPDELTALARAAIARAGEADAEVYATHTRRGMARFAVGEVGQHMMIDEPEAQVRVARRARQGEGVGVGEASTTDLSEEGIARALRDAAQIAELSPPRVPFPGFARPTNQAPQLAGPTGTMPSPLPHRFSDATAACDPQERADALRPLLQTIRGAGLVAAGALQTIAQSTALVTSHGVELGHRATIASARVWALETAGAGGASGFDSAVGRELRALHVGRLAERAVRDASDARATQRSLPSGSYDVVLEPEAVASLLEWLSNIAFGAIELEQGSSLFAGRIGERVTGERVTITDDPLAHDGAIAAAPFDREGSPRRRVVLLERGVARSVLHDRTTAARMGAESTGSAVTGWSRGVVPGACALKMEGGDAQGSDELMRVMGRGLHVRRFHYVNGFLEPRRAVMTGLTRDGTFLIEGGQRVASVGNLRFTDSIVEAFGRIEAMTREVRAVGSHYADDSAIRAPAILLRGLKFTSGTPPSAALP